MARPRKQLPAVYENSIRRMALEGYTAREIYATLNGNISLRTIQRRIVELVPPPGPAWTLAAPDWGKAELVLPVLAEVIERSEGRVREISRDLAKWIVRVRRAAPTIPLWDAYELAVAYQRSAQGAKGALPLAALDAYLAFRPWEPQGAERWRLALAGGSVPLFPPGFFDRLWKKAGEGEEEGVK